MPRESAAYTLQPPYQALPPLSLALAEKIDSQTAVRCMDIIFILISKSTGVEKLYNYTL